MAKKKRPPWFNQVLTASKIELNRAHRVMLRADTPETRKRFRVARNRHVSNILSAKKVIWVKFVEEHSLCNNIWGKLTKWLIKGNRAQTIPSALRKHDGRYTSCIEDTLQYMLEELIPTSDADTSPDQITRGSNTCSVSYS